VTLNRPSLALIILLPSEAKATVAEKPKNEPQRWTARGSAAEAPAPTSGLNHRYAFVPPCCSSRYTLRLDLDDEVAPATEREPNAPAAFMVF